MSDAIKHKDGVPTIEDFASNDGPPIIINDLTGVAYVVTSGDVVKPMALILENRTSDPPSPETGRLWIRTDL